jgi:hypothetical protein
MRFLNVISFEKLLVSSKHTSKEHDARGSLFLSAVARFGASPLMHTKGPIILLVLL